MKFSKKIVHFALYSVFLIYISLFKFSLIGKGLYVYPFDFSFNFIPFSQSTVTNGHVSLLGILASICLFVPIGFFLNRLNVRILTSFINACAFSLLLELGQMLLGTGIADITDTLLNVAGFFIGFTLFSLYTRQKHFMSNRKEATY